MAIAAPAVLKKPLAALGQTRLITIFKIKELRTKILITVLFLAIYIIGSVIMMTCGTVFLMWLGEQIDEYGIGNGISLIIMAGIVARIPDATQSLLFERGHLRSGIFMLGGSGTGGDVGLEKLIVLIAMFIAVVVAVVAITKG